VSPHCHFIWQHYNGIWEEVQNWRNCHLPCLINFLEGLQLGQNEFIIEKLLGKLLSSEDSLPHYIELEYERKPPYEPTQPLWLYLPFVFLIYVTLQVL
jgi:hypothetical protein